MSDSNTLCISLSQAAELLGVTPQQLYEMTRHRSQVGRESHYPTCASENDRPFAGKVWSGVVAIHLCNLFLHEFTD